LGRARDALPARGARAIVDRMRRLAVLGVFALACAEEHAPPPPRTEAVTVAEPEPQAPTSAPVDPDVPSRGGERPPFEVVIQALAASEARGLAAGERFAALSAPDAGYASILDLATGSIRATRSVSGLEVIAVSARSVLFAPAAGAEGAMCLWDLADDALSCLPGDPLVLAHAFAPGGGALGYLTRAEARTELWVDRLGVRARRLAAVPAAEGELELHFHPRGVRILISGSLGHLVDARSGRVIAETPPPARGQPFDPLGRFLITFATDAVEVRNARSGRVVRRVERSAPPASIAWSPRGEHFCFGTTRVSTATGAVQELAAPCGDALARDGSPAPSPAPSARVDPSGPAHVDERGRRTAIAERSVPRIDGVLLAEGGLELSWILSGDPRRRFVMTHDQRREVAEPPFFVTADGVRAAIEPERRVVWVQRELARTVDLRDVPAELDLECSFDAGSTLACAARPAFSTDRRHVALGPHLFDAETGARVGVLSGARDSWIVRGDRALHSDGIYDLTGRRVSAASGTSAFSPDGALAAIASRRRIDVLSSESGAAVRTIRTADPVQWIAWDAPDSMLVFSTRGQLARISAEDGALVSSLQIGTPRGSDPERRRLVLCDGGLVHLLSTRELAQRGPLGRCPAGGEFIVPSDGPFVAWTDGMRARVHRVSDGEVLEIVPHEGAAVATTDSGWFESFGVPPELMRLRTGTIQRGRLRRAERSDRERPGLLLAFLAGAPFEDPP
jgi:hypothetical protein